jgi:hypothetical protein
MADQPELFTPTPTAQPNTTNLPRIQIPDAVQNVPTSFLSNQERLSQAREAARSGTEATGFISYNQ